MNDDIERCPATNRQGEPCGHPAGWGTDFDDGKCKFHRGTSPDGSSHQGNGNAEKHSLHADRGLFYDRLPDDKQATIDRLESALIDRYQEIHGRDPDAADVHDLFEIAIGYVQRDFAREYLIEQMAASGNPLLEHVELEKGDGTTVEFDKPNELLDHIEHNRKEDRMQRKDKGLEEDPESQKADEMAAWRDFITQE